jgi:hypothetical protein
MKKSKKRMYLHGECVISELEKLPEGLLPKNEKDSIMIAESETVGNEHRIKIKDGVEIFEDVNGTLYMKNSVSTEVYCLHAERHDTITIPEGFWQIDKAVEYDYFSDKIREIKD